MAAQVVPVFTNLKELYGSLGTSLNHAERWSNLADEFEKRFGKKPTHIVRAPGRVNLIGEHIDYALFGVLPAAIERDILIACAPREIVPNSPTEEAHHAPGSVVAENLHPKYTRPSFRSETQRLARRMMYTLRAGIWIFLKSLDGRTYVKAGYYGVLNEHFTGATEHPTPVDMLVTCTLTFLAMNGKACSERDMPMSIGDLVKLSMENEKRVGVNSGGMDQAASVMSVPSSMLYITFYPVPYCFANATAQYVVSDKALTAEKGYNLRVVETLVGARILARSLQVQVGSNEKVTLREVVGRYVAETDVGKGGKGMDEPALIDVLGKMDEALESLKASRNDTPRVWRHDGGDGRDVWAVARRFPTSLLILVDATHFKLYKRTKHVFSEALRVLQFRKLCLETAAKGTTDGDNATVLQELGRLMNESQTSWTRGAYGSRLTGAGWGGCTVSLVPEDQVDSFIKKVAAAYPAYKGLEGDALSEVLFATRPSVGACVADAVAVTFQPGDDVTALKNLILLQWGPDGVGLAPANIRLWKPNLRLPLQDLATLEQARLDLTAIATQMVATDDVELLVPRTQQTPSIHVIAQFLPRHGSHHSAPVEEQRDIPSVLKSRLRNLIEYALSSKSSNYQAAQRGQYPIYDGRYNPNSDVSTMALPVHLYNPVFAQFMDDVADSNLKVPDKVVVATADLMSKASAIYENEDIRQSKIRPALKDAISFVVWTMSETDGSLDTAVALMVDEELGVDECDASIQASFAMLRPLIELPSSRMIKFAQDAVALPSLLPLLALGWLSLAPVLTDKCVVQRLTDLIWVGNGTVLNDRNQCFRVARVLHSLTRALGHLRNYYSALTPSNDFEPSRFFPSPTSFLSSGNGAPVHFEYRKALEGDAECATFLCRTQEDEPRLVVVKFAETYCPEAQKLLAQNGLAPDLFYCGPVDYSNGAPSYHLLKMIVMEYIDGKTVAQLHGKPPEDFQKQLTAMVSLMHNDEYVFGDLRWPNITCTC
ncbi:hypothetical protein C8F01DRAFT_1324025 [Mycena amicta]|nr:hypothetical protein C8F01DRAFT_1324025 [Mycena amicta]